MLNELKRNLRDFQASPLSDHRFDESHECFEGQSNQQEQILQCLRDFGRHQIDRRVTKAIATERVFRVLSVGCGSGILDLPLIKTLADQISNGNSASKIHYTGIDPNPVACDRFRNEFLKLSLSSSQLKVLEDTVESYDHDNQFDLIHVVHALYYFVEPAVALQKLIRIVADEGQLVIFQAPKAELNQLADCFWQDHLKDPIWFSEDLEDHLLKVNASFIKSRLDAEVDVTNCFESNDTNGQLTLDFIVQSHCENLSQPIRQSVLSYLKSISRVHNGKVLAPHPVDVFIIDRPF